MQDGGGKCWPNDDTVFTCSLVQLLQSSLLRRPTEVSVPRLYRKEYRRGFTDLPGDCHVGQLTLKGFEQHTQNGKYLAAAYPDLFNSISAEDQFYLRSDDSQRTIMSGQALFDSIRSSQHFGANNQDIMIGSVGWYTSDSGLDDICGSDTLCPALNNEISRAHQSPDFQNHIKDG